MSTVELRACDQEDLDLFFELQQDTEAGWMAAFTRENPADRTAFDAHWTRIFDDGSVVKRTIVCDGEVVGNIMTFVEDGDTEITYWVDRACWGRGIASKALALILNEVTIRPIRARVVKDNRRSLAVLRRKGFTIIGENNAYAAGRGEVVGEYLLRLV